MKRISYDGIGAVVATFHVEESVCAGAVVKLTESCTVAECVEGDSFAGVVFDCDAPLASVQVEGFVTLGCTGVVPLGLVTLVADGDGGVKVSTGAGVTALVVDNEESGFVTVRL